MKTPARPQSAMPADVRATTRAVNRAISSASTAAPASTVATSEGQRLLLGVKGSQNAVARRLGVTGQAVAFWRSGEKRPGPTRRAALQEAYGIPLESWDVVPGTAAPAAGAPAEPGQRAQNASTLADVLALIDFIRAERQTPGKLAADVEKLVAAERHALALRHRIEEDATMLEDRFVREHPAWRRFVAVSLKALAPYPDAMRALAGALETIDGVR